MSEYTFSKIKVPVWLSGLFFLLLFFFIYKVFDIIALFAFAFILAYLINILVKFLEKKGHSRNFSIILSLLLLFTVFVLLWRFLFPPLLEQLNQIQQSATIYIKDIHSKGVDATRNDIGNEPGKNNKFIKHIDYLVSGLAVKYPQIISSLGGKEKISAFIIDKQQQILSFLIALLGGFSSRAVSFLSHIFNLIFIPILCIYFLLVFESLKKRVLFIIERTSYRHEILSFFKEVNIMLEKYLKSQLLIMFLATVSNTILASIISAFFGIKYALFIGCLTGIIWIIPYFGTCISVLAAVIICLSTATSSPFVAAIIMLILMLVINQIFDSYITPKIIGDSLGIHPLLNIFALLAAGKLGGFIGLLLAVPIAGVIKIIVLRSFPQFFPPPLLKSANRKKHRDRYDIKDKSQKASLRIPSSKNMSPFLVNEKKNDEKKSVIHKSLNLSKKAEEPIIAENKPENETQNAITEKKDEVKKNVNKKRRRFPPKNLKKDSDI